MEIFVLLITFGLMYWPAADAAPATHTRSCHCPKITLPVCGIDGKTYSNSCLAQCSGTLTKHRGRCKTSRKSCMCGRVRRLVCGANGKTYRNLCHARCRKAKIVYKGHCIMKHCRCTRHVQRVCGSNGHTYINPCTARCSSVTVAHRGKCSEDETKREFSDFEIEIFEKFIRSQRRRALYAYEEYMVS